MDEHIMTLISISCVIVGRANHRKRTLTWNVTVGGTGYRKRTPITYVIAGGSVMVNLLLPRMSLLEDQS